MNKIKAAVAGIGFIGAAHVEALRRLGNVEVEAICDAETIVGTKAEQLGIKKYYSDYNEMLNNKEIECVHICTPNHLHFEMSYKALNAGKHVICEKPLTNTPEEAEKLVSLAEQKGLVNAVNFNIRYYPLMRQVKIMIEKGEIGDIFAVHGTYLQDWLCYDTDYNWRLDSEMSGRSRAVADIGSHWMDLIEYISGIKADEVLSDFATFHKIRKKPVKPVETYSGKLLSDNGYEDIPINTEDYATVLFRFQNDARGVMTVSQVSAGRKNRIYFEIHGSKKSVAWDSEKPNEIWIGRRDGKNEILIKDPSLMYPECQALVSYPGGHSEGFPDTFKQNFKEIYSRISSGEHKGECSFPTFMDGLREIMLCEKIVESSQSRGWIKI